MAGHCSAAGALADRLGLGADVRAGIEQAYARWDGRGVPDDLSGPELSLAARISHVAEACEYAMVGVGEGRAVRFGHRRQDQRPRQPARQETIWDRRAKMASAGRSGMWSNR